MQEPFYVWEFPVRLCHWINVIAVVTLSMTGYYIGNPMVQGEAGIPLMHWARLVHFSFAYVLLISVLVRSIWFFIGNRYSSWRMFFPWATKKGRANAKKFFDFYTFTGRAIPYEVGHNALACMAYAGVFTLYIVQIVSGFTLYGQLSPGGFWDTLFGPLLSGIGNQTLRLTHHMAMYLLWGFVINHLYSAWLMDLKEKNGTVSSMFGGYKYIDPEEL